MKKHFVIEYCLPLLFMIFSTVMFSQTPVISPAKTISQSIVANPKKIYEWSQPYNGSQLHITVAVYDVNKFTTLIREKDNTGKIIAYRYASLPGDGGGKSVFHESGIPLRGFPQSFLSRLDAGYHINVPPSVADQIGNDFKGVLDGIKDLLKGPQNEIDKFRSSIGKGSDPFGQMNIGDGTSLPLGHQAKELHNGKMGPTPYEIVNGKANTGYASDDEVTVDTHSNSDESTIITTTVHDDGSKTINTVSARSDGDVEVTHTEQNSDHTVTVTTGTLIHNDGSGTNYQIVNDHHRETTVYNRSFSGKSGTPSETSSHHFTSDEINQMFVNHLGWFAEEFCFRKKKEPADFLNPTRSPVADGAGGNVNVNHLGKDAVINPNENKLKNINPNSGSDSARKIQQTHVDPPNTRKKSKGN